MTRAALSAVSILLAASLAGCSHGDKKPVRPAPLVEVASVTQRDVPVEVRAPVDLRPLVQADISSKIQGYLDAVLVDRGDHVKKGQVVAVVRPSDLPDQLAAARSSLTSAQAQAELAEANWKRVKSLAPEGVVSQQELQASEAQHASTQAAVASARAQVAALATRYGETRIEAPMDGVVIDRRLDPGALVGSQGSSAVILTLARTDVLRAFIAVNERDAARVKLDQPAHVSVDALGNAPPVTGKVVRVAPAFDPVTRTLDAEIQIPNPNGDLFPGMYGRGAITTEVHPGAVVAPVDAVQISNEKPYVFVVENGVAHRRPIRIGVDGGDWFEVLDGLKAGDQVVIAGQDGLADGAKVRTPTPPEPGEKRTAASPSDGGVRDDAQARAAATSSPEAVQR